MEKKLMSGIAGVPFSLEAYILPSRMYKHRAGIVSIHILKRYASEAWRIEANIESLPFRERIFLRYTFLHSLEVTLVPSQALEEVHRVLQREGFLNVRAFQCKPVDAAGKENYRFTRNGLESLVRAAGFEVKSCRTEGDFWSSLSFLEEVYLRKLDAPQLYKKICLGLLFLLRLSDHFLDQCLREQRDSLLHTLHAKKATDSNGIGQRSG